MKDFYFAFGEDQDFGDAYVVITPKKLWDEEQRWCDQGTEASLAVERLGLPLGEDAESVFSFTEEQDLDEMRALLTAHGAVENPDLIGDDPWG